MAHCGPPKDGTVPQIWPRFLNPTKRRSGSRAPFALFNLFYIRLAPVISFISCKEKKGKAIFMPNLNVDNLPKVAV